MRLIDADAYEFPGDLINEPTINPDDLRAHGWWEVNTDNFTPAYRCSACGYQMPMVAGEYVLQGAMNFCPNCGAMMNGKENEDARNIIPWQAD